MASRPYILSVGTIKKRKGYDVSIPAFRELASEFPGISYVIVGKGTLDLPPHVQLVSDLSREELDELYRNAELFLLAPTEVEGDVEGFGLVFLEAAKAGLPIIATRSGGVEDAVEEGKNAFLCAPGDVACLAEMMKKVLHDPALRGRMCEASRAFAKRMSWDVQIAKYVHLYQTL